jgi:hypothetical protein
VVVESQEREREKKACAGPTDAHDQLTVRLSVNGIPISRVIDLSPKLKPYGPLSRPITNKYIKEVQTQGAGPAATRWFYA